MTDYFHGKSHTNAWLEVFLATPSGERGGHFLTTREAAEWCGLSQRTIQAWIESDKIPFLRVGTKYLIPREPLARYLEKRDRD